MMSQPDEDQYKEWRSIVTLIVFVVANIFMVFPLDITIYIPRKLVDTLERALGALRIIPQPPARSSHNETSDPERFLRVWTTLDYVNVPLLGVFFLWAISAIGKKEFHDGTVGTNGIYPVDVMVLSMCLAYMGLSIEASGLLKYLSFHMLRCNGTSGNKLFLLLYLGSFILSMFLGNEPVVLSATPLLAALTTFVTNIIHPRAWIHTQLSISNIGASMLVSSSTTNLIIAQTFNIKFIDYTANMTVPVVVAVVILFPLLLYIIFNQVELIPYSIRIYELSEEEMLKRPSNPHLRFTRTEEFEEEFAEQNRRVLIECANPFLDKGSALVGSFLMLSTIIILLVFDAAGVSNGEHTVFWVAVPGTFLLFCWDTASGWHRRLQSRLIVKEYTRQRKIITARRAAFDMPFGVLPSGSFTRPVEWALFERKYPYHSSLVLAAHKSGRLIYSPEAYLPPSRGCSDTWAFTEPQNGESSTIGWIRMEVQRVSALEEKMSSETAIERTTLKSLVEKLYHWLKVTFPATIVVVKNLPLDLIPFTLSMFILTQALVDNGWVPVFAHGWDHWVEKTGVVGTIFGMATMSVIICNFIGTNIGTTILLSRVLKTWLELRGYKGDPISERTFVAAMYSLAIGSNFGGSSAGILWRRELARRNICVGTLDYARVSTSIIWISLTVACAALIGQVYITRGNSPYQID